jgi:hypothetical protein
MTCGFPESKYVVEIKILTRYKYHYRLFCVIGVRQLILSNYGPIYVYIIHLSKIPSPCSLSEVRETVMFLIRYRNRSAKHFELNVSKHSQISICS